MEAKHRICHRNRQKEKETDKRLKTESDRETGRTTPTA